MIFDEPEKIRLSVGNGRNHFTMEKGSFSYDEEISRRVDLSFLGTEQNGDALDLLYGDGEGGKAVLTLRETDGLMLLEYRGYTPSSGPELPGSELPCTELPDPERMPAVLSSPNRFWISFPASETEHLYGCGETYSEWDLKGRKVRIFTAEHQNAKRIEAKRARLEASGPDPDFRLPFPEYESYFVTPTAVSSEK